MPVPGVQPIFCKRVIPIPLFRARVSFSWFFRGHAVWRWSCIGGGRLASMQPEKVPKNVTRIEDLGRIRSWPMTSVKRHTLDCSQFRRVEAQFPDRSFTELLSLFGFNIEWVALESVRGFLDAIQQLWTHRFLEQRSENIQSRTIFFVDIKTKTALTCGMVRLLISSSSLSWISIVFGGGSQAGYSTASCSVFVASPGAFLWNQKEIPHQNLP